MDEGTIDRQELEDSLRKSFLYWDIECLSVIGTPQACYLSTMVGWIDGVYYENIIYAKEPEDDVMREFAKTLLGLHTTCMVSKRKGPLTIWTFNGLKYEMKYLLQPLTEVF